MRLSDLEGEDRRRIEEELEAKSSGMGFSAWETVNDGDSNFLKEHIGICHNCKNLQYCRAEFAGHDSVYARCNELEIRISGQKRITECNCYSPRKMLTLTEMYAMATLIDPAKPEIKGFISRDPKLMKNE